MENRPIVAFTGISPTPWARAEEYERQRKWQDEAYPTLIMTIPELIGLEQYSIVKENLEYPYHVSTSHYKSLKDWKTQSTGQQRTALGTEFKSWVDRGVIDYVWSSVYSLVQSFRSKPSFSDKNEDTRIENAHIMHLEAYRFSEEEHEKYVKWFTEYGITIFMPLFMKLPGLAGYDLCKNTGLRLRDFIGELEYPEYLSIIYFENIKAYDEYSKSPELAGFYKAIRGVIPHRLNYKWYVQYQLDYSHRK